MTHLKPFCLLGLAIAFFTLSCKHEPAAHIHKSLAPIPEWAKNSVIYEVNIRQYTPEGTFAAFESHLPRLKEMGVDILWLMPIHPIGEKNRKGSLGSYYSVKDYTAVNPEYGTMDDFRHLVSKVHEHGMKLIIDWVANHTAWDHAWVGRYPDFYAKDSANQMYGPFDWSDVAQLDYSNIALRKEMTNALAFWVREADIDGFRCDVAGMVPVDFWEDARAELEKVKPVFMLAEDEDKTTLLHKAFNANYAWAFHHLMNKTAHPKDSAFLIADWIAKADTVYPAGAFAMQFTSNHDENSWNGTEYERLGNAVKTYATLAFVAPGMPLVYSGQEAGLKKRLRFFDKDTIAWDDLSMARFYKQLTGLKHQNAALANGSWGGKTNLLTTDQPSRIVAFERTVGRNNVISVFNLSADSVSVALNVAVNGYFTDYFAGQTTSIPSTLTLSPWEFKVFVKQ
ncbi:MAG: alpha-amylase family glycosyl hydrolase [Breznakibacter sp.]